MAVSKVTINEVPQYKPIPSKDPKVKRYQQGELILEISDKGKVWKHAESGKIVAKGPLGKDVFQKSQPVDLEGKVVNKNGVINN